MLPSVSAARHVPVAWARRRGSPGDRGRRAPWTHRGAGGTFAVLVDRAMSAVRLRCRRLLLTASFALRGQPEVYKLGLLAFTAGILLTVAVEEIVVEAHREEDGRTASLVLVGGFALLIALGELLEARAGSWRGDRGGEDVRSVRAGARPGSDPGDGSFTPGDRLQQSSRLFCSGTIP